MVALLKPSLAAGVSGVTVAITAWSFRYSTM